MKKHLLTACNVVLEWLLHTDGKRACRISTSKRNMVVQNIICSLCVWLHNVNLLHADWHYNSSFEELACFALCNKSVISIAISLALTYICVCCGQTLQGETDLKVICEALLDYCLAPRQEHPGIDNMTVILVQFKRLATTASSWSKLADPGSVHAWILAYPQRVLDFDQQKYWNSWVGNVIVLLILPICLRWSWFHCVGWFHFHE